MAKLSKELKERIVISVTSEKYGKELIDAIEKGDVLSGNGVPINSLGNNGDLYINLLNGDLYVKYNDSWALSVPGSQKIIAGQYSMPDSSSAFTVSGLSLGTTNYIVNITIENTVDVSIRHLVATVTAKTVTSFSFVTPQTTDHPNYKANYIIYKL